MRVLIFCPMFFFLKHFSLSAIFSDMLSHMYVRLHVKYWLFSSDLNKTQTSTTYFQQILKYQISWKSVQCQPSCSMRTDGQTDMTKLFQYKFQQDATLHSLFISGNCSTWFGWHLHPLSGAHTTISTASGICHTVTATCRYCGSSNSSTIATDSSNGVTNTRCCRYSCMQSWWWVKVPPETCRAVSR